MMRRPMVPAILWALLLLVLTLLPGKYIPPVNIWDIASFDKIIHFSVFAIFSLLLAIGFALQNSNLTNNQVLFLSVIISVLYGIILETMQGTLLIDRQFELYDMMANSVGCIFGIIIFKFVQFKLQY